MKKTIKGATAFALTIMMIGTMSATVFAATAQDVMNKNVSGYTAGTQSVYGPKLTQDQLNAVADVVVDFKTNYTNDSMTNDQKIRAGYDYIKNRVSYIDWDKGVGANTAYALVTGQGACSGMTRGFIALMDAVDVKAYLIHADTNDHQWILTEFDDGFAYIDIDANVSAGFEAIYHAKTHPYTYDTNGLPAIGSHSSNNGAKTAVAEGWKQDANGWWYQNADGSYLLNTWQVLNDKWYYFEANGYMAVNKWIGDIYYVGSDGVMLTNTTTPDGYQVDGSGARAQGQQSMTSVGGHTKSMSDSEAAIDMSINIIEERVDTNGNPYVLVSEETTTVSIIGSLSNVSPQNLKISMAVYRYNPSTNTIYTFSNDGTAVWLPFEYDKVYDIQITNVNLTGKELVEYCKINNLAIAINATDITTNEGRGFIICYK